MQNYVFLGQYAITKSSLFHYLPYPQGPRIFCDCCAYSSRCCPYLRAIAPTVYRIPRFAAQYVVPIHRVDPKYQKLISSEYKNENLYILKSVIEFLQLIRAHRKEVEVECRPKKSCTVAIVSTACTAGVRIGVFVITPVIVIGPLIVLGVKSLNSR